MIRKELIRMAQEKLLTKKQLELLLELPEERLSLVVSTLMSYIFLLKEEDIKKLINAKNKTQFRRQLAEIKNSFEEDTFVTRKMMRYQVAKMWGLIDFKANDREVFLDELRFLINEIITPSLKLLSFYRKKGLLKEEDYSLLVRQLQEAYD